MRRKHIPPVGQSVAFQWPDLRHPCISRARSFEAHLYLRLLPLLEIQIKQQTR